MEDRYFNILVVGTPHVGKSRIISKYLNDNFNTILRTPRNEFESSRYDICSKSIEVRVWETGVVHPNQKEFYAKIMGVLFVYDVSNPTSVHSLTGYYEAIQNYLSPNVVFFVIGNKIDLFLPSNEKFIATRLPIRYWAEAHSMYYCETSTRASNHRLFDVFWEMGKKIYQARLNNDNNDNKLSQNPTSLIKSTITLLERLR